MNFTQFTITALAATTLLGCSTSTPPRDQPETAQAVQPVAAPPQTSGAPHASGAARPARPATALVAPGVAVAGPGKSAASHGIDGAWRSAFNVHELDPIATTGVTAGGADSVFEEPDAMLFVRRNPSWRGHLVASDIRFDATQPSKSRLLLFKVQGAQQSGRLALAKTFGEGHFVGKPKSLAEDSRGRFFVTDGLDKSDKVSGAVRAKQGIHLFDAQLRHVKTFGQGVFESVNGITIDSKDRLYVTERSLGLVRRFTPDGKLDNGWKIDDTEVQKTDNMVVAEQLSVGGTTGVIFLSDEERGMVRFYALADGRFLGRVLGNDAQCQASAGDDAKLCFRRQSLFNGNVEGMALHGHLLALMDEADKPLAGKEDGGVIWFFDVRESGIYNQRGAAFAGNTGKSGLIGGIHKRSPHTQKAVEKNVALAAQVPPGAFISADSLDIHVVDGRRLLAVANQGVLRLELFDLDTMLEQLGVDRARRQSLYGKAP